MKNDLINCPACDHAVSASAASCPQCGHPIAGKKTEATTGLSALLVVVGIATSGYVGFTYAYKMSNQILGIALVVLPTAVAMALASIRKK